MFRPEQGGPAAWGKRPRLALPYRGGMSRSRQSKNPKRVLPSKKIERQGIALIGKIVADMGHLWNEPQDFGIDGSIELVSPASDAAP
jgi:hypothetical protein